MSTTPKKERRRWRCPACNAEYRIPDSADDPTLCPECAAQIPEKPVIAAPQLKSSRWKFLSDMNLVDKINNDIRYQAALAVFVG